MSANRRNKSELRDETKLLVDLAELWHERGVDMPTRTIFLGSESIDNGDESGVDARLAERVLKNIHLLERLGDGPITLLINNPGGEVYDGLAIIDAIERCRCEVIGVVRGSAMSMASWILQACDQRVMGPRSTQMVHYGYAGFSGHAKTAERHAEENKRLDALMEATYLKRIRERRPSYAIDELRTLLAHDTFLNAEQSVTLGLADTIG